MPTMISSATGKAAPPDRPGAANKTIDQSISAGAATRATTIDAAYTAPAGMKADITSHFNDVRQQATAATNGEANSITQFTPSGGSAKILFAATAAAGNTGAQVIALGDRAHTLLPGDKVELVSNSDNSAASTDVRLRGSVGLMEYAA